MEQNKEDSTIQNKNKDTMVSEYRYFLYRLQIFFSRVLTKDSEIARKKEIKYNVLIRNITNKKI